MKVYVISHCYDTDGGFGDAIQQKDTICVVNSIEDAEYVKEELQNEHIYDKPYDALKCGYIDIDEIEILDRTNLNSFLQKFKQSGDVWWLVDYDEDEEDEY